MGAVLRPGDAARDGRAALAGEHVHAIIVLADHGDRKPYAVVTDRDLLRAADRFDELTAGEVAKETILEARASEPLSEAARRMADHDATHAVVVDDHAAVRSASFDVCDIAGVLGWGGLTA